ncbi:MAG: cysteine desulfurase [Clostridia bacterium]|nr:cysteine desulfurase [Clostridia bacterium]
MDKIIYLDHAATTSVDERVLREMIPYFTNNYGNPSSVYSIGKINRKKIDNARKQVAESIGAKPEEIYFTSCGSESDNLAIKGIAKAYKTRGRHIITSKIEHPAVLETCKTLEKEGFDISYINVDEKGIVKLDELKRAMRRDTILISIMYANNEIGTIQPIEEIGRIARQNRIYFHTDCVQAVGNLEIDVRKQNIDSLSMSAHKFYGPKGVGALYIRDGVGFVRQQDGGHQEKDKRAGTENVAGIIGLGKAIEISSRNLNEYNRHLKTLRDIYVRSIINRFKYIHVNGDIDKRLPGNMNISFLGIKGSDLVEELDKRGICCSSGSACSAGIIQPSKVILATGANKNIAESALRVTFGRENSVEDVKFLIDSLEDIVGKFRK